VERILTKWGRRASACLATVSMEETLNGDKLMDINGNNVGGVSIV
jgi:hypothetical protein